MTLWAKSAAYIQKHLQSLGLACFCLLNQAGLRSFGQGDEERIVNVLIICFFPLSQHLKKYTICQALATLMKIWHFSETLWTCFTFFFLMHIFYILGHSAYQKLEDTISNFCIFPVNIMPFGACHLSLIFSTSISAPYRQQLKQRHRNSKKYRFLIGKYSYILLMCQLCSSTKI